VPEPCQCDGRLSVKQRSAQLPLQRADGGGERGLRDAAATGCAGETELLAQGQEVMDLRHLHWSRLPFADRRADGSAGRLCSMLSLSQADRLVLGSCVDGPRLARDHLACSAEVACSHVSGLLVQSGGLLALMGSANRVLIIQTGSMSR